MFRLTATVGDLKGSCPFPYAPSEMHTNAAEFSCSGYCMRDCVVNSLKVTGKEQQVSDLNELYSPDQFVCFVLLVHLFF